MSKKALTVSIVIPVYNEESYIGACLDAIASQTQHPLEVIVVDNNSTDDTLNVVRRYPFVKVMYEKRQGQVFAQSTGFRVAKGEILGRIDADTHISETWVADVREAFQEDAQVVAVTGPGVPYDVPLKMFGSAIFNFYHNRLARLFSGHQMLWGSNFAMHSTAWRSVEAGLHQFANLWEDYDLSFHLAQLGRIRHLSKLRVTCSFRAAHQSIPHQLEYQYRCIRTFRLHRSGGLVFVLFLAWFTMVALTPLAILDRYLWLAHNAISRMLSTEHR